MPSRRNIGHRQFSMRPRALIPQRPVSSSSNDFASSPCNPDGQSGLPAADNLEVQPLNNITQLQLPVMSGLAFEFFFMAYLLCALFAQYLYIFKTVWWYPNTLPPSTMTLNFHLIDKSLTIFLVFLFSGRLLWFFMWSYIRPSTTDGLFVIMWLVLSISAFSFWIWEMGHCVFSLLGQVKPHKLLFLCYPLLLWLPLNYLTDDGCVKSIINFFKKKNVKGRHALTLNNRTDPLDLFVDQKSEPDSVDADQVRDDVKQLCQSFNSRLAEILFGSSLCCYYAGFIPMYFTKLHHSYDAAWSLQHTALILVNSFTMLSAYLLPPNYLQTLTRSALSLGGYKLVKDCDIQDGQEVKDWSMHSVFPQGSYVKYKSKTYLAVGKHNAAVPDSTTHTKFFYVFYKPLRVIDWLLGLQAVVVMFQLHIVIDSSHWDHIIGPALLQFFSYYVLYMMIRDRLVLKKLCSLRLTV